MDFISTESPFFKYLYSLFLYRYAPVFPPGKIILFTKKNTTIDTPPFNTVVPILYNQSGTNIPATATQMYLMEFTIQVIIQSAIRYLNA